MLPAIKEEDGLGGGIVDADLLCGLALTTEVTSLMEIPSWNTFLSSLRFVIMGIRE
jgi:hypothetical protein